MQQALKQAQHAAVMGEVPVGAVVVDAKGEFLASAHNLTETESDPSGHAEILAIRAACQKRKSPRLPDCDLYVTLEPCPICAGTIANARIRRVYFGAYDPKGGAVEHGVRLFDQPSCHHKPEVVGGIQETECAAILKTFFQKKR